jgi:hypothetical protein
MLAPHLFLFFFLVLCISLFLRFLPPLSMSSFLPSCISQSFLISNIGVLYLYIFRFSLICTFPSYLIYVLPPLSLFFCFLPSSLSLFWTSICLSFSLPHAVLFLPSVFLFLSFLLSLTFLLYLLLHTSPSITSQWPRLILAPQTFMQTKHYAVRTRWGISQVELWISDGTGLK